MLTCVSLKTEKILRKYKTTRPHYLFVMCLIFNWNLKGQKLVFTWPCSRGHWQASIFKEALRNIPAFGSTQLCVFGKRIKASLTFLLFSSGFYQRPPDYAAMPGQPTQLSILVVALVCTASSTKHSLFYFSATSCCMLCSTLPKRTWSVHLAVHAVSVQPLTCISCWQYEKILYHINTSVPSIVVVDCRPVCKNRRVFLWYIFSLLLLMYRIKPVSNIGYLFAKTV